MITKQLELIKFIVYSSDDYYPYAEEFDSYIEADKAFGKLKKSRLNDIKRWNPEDRCLPFFDKDYLCIVISEIDVKKLKQLKLDGEILDEEFGTD